MNKDNDTVSFAPVTRRMRVPMIAVAGVFAAASIAVLALVLTGSNGQETLLPVQPVAEDVDDAPIAEDSDAAEDADADVAEVAVPTVTHEVYLARDPFEPVVPEDFGEDPEAAAADDPDAVDPEGTADPDPEADGFVPPELIEGTDGGPEGPPSGDAGTDPSPCFGETEVVCDGQVVTLVDVTAEGDDAVAVVRVDTTVHEVQRGEVFAGNFQLRAIDGTCVSLLYGDDGFQLCTGDTILK